MKKSFPLQVPGHQAPRVIESIKSKVRKYIKRERRKPLTEGVDFCNFACRSGKDADSAVEIHHEQLIACIDTAAREGWPAIYIEILAKPGIRMKKNPGPNPTPGLAPEKPGDE